MTRSDNTHSTQRERSNPVEDVKSEPMNFSGRNECHYRQERHHTHSTINDDLAGDDVNVEIDWRESFHSAPASTAYTKERN